MDPVAKARVSYRFDDVLVDSNRRRIEKAGQPHKITPRSFDVLVYLVEHRDRIVEKQELFDEVWKEKFVTDNALTRVIKEIRQVIGDDADAPRYIETLHRRGYRFIATITEAEEAEPVTQKTEAPHVEQVLIPPAEPRNNAVAETAVVPPKVSRIRFSRSTLLVAALASITVALIALIGIVPSSGGTPTQLTFDRGLSWAHSWSPDGDKIAFAGYRDGYWNVWWVARSTKIQRQVTSYAQPNAYVRYPAWSPLGNQIVYEYAETTGNIWLMELK